MKTVIITGGSSGIGLETVKSLLESDCRVYEFSRRDFSLPGVIHMCVDVSDEKAMADAVGSVYAAEGRIDILINCAGFGISGAAEFTDTADAKRQFDVNFFGTVNAAGAVIPYMRAAGAGRIVNITSVAAVAPIPFQSFYSASKAALNSYSCALANEVGPFGISVTAVMPGDICTGFTDARKKILDGDDVYNGRISGSVSRMERDEINGMAPSAAGRFICRIALKKRVRPIYSIGVLYKFLSVLCMILPCTVKNRLIGKLYG